MLINFYYENYSTYPSKSLRGEKVNIHKHSPKEKQTQIRQKQQNIITNSVALVFVIEHLACKSVWDWGEIKQGK